MRPRLSVCCATADPGARVTEALRPLRQVADEIVVAVDSRVDPEGLGSYESVADRVVRFEFGSFVEQSLEWAASLCSGTWILRLDGDEVASTALTAALPRLIEADDVLQYWLPCRWIHPDGRRWFDEWPWWPDFSNRLVRNDSRLRFDGLAHTGASPDFPARYVEEPFYHLLCAVSSRAERERKVASYAGLDPTSKAPGSDRLLRHFYLPEDHATLEPVAIPEDDRPLVDASLRAGSGAAPTMSSTVRLFGRAEIDRFWAQRMLRETAYRATIEPVSSYRRMRPGDHRPFRVRVRNDGDTRWPGGHDRAPLIRLSYRWSSSAGTPIVADGFRSPLPAPLEPDETCIAPVIVAAPDDTGEYVLEVDLVHEHIRWFDCSTQVGMRVEHDRTSRRPDGRVPSKTSATREATRTPPSAMLADAGPSDARDAEASVTAVDRYRWMTAGRHTPFHVLVRNQSARPWPGPDRERPIRLGYRWLRQDGTTDLGEGLRTALPSLLAPGATSIVPMVVQAPVEPGSYVLEIDVVHEFVRWLECAVAVEIDVRSPEAAPRLQLPPWASHWLASADPGFLDRIARICGLEHDQAHATLFEHGLLVEVPILALGGGAAWLRPATSDTRVVDDTFWGRYHVPPADLETPRTVLDLGSNIGLTMADFAYLFPDARIAGVELDAENVAIARRNVAPWSDRCAVIHAAIWSEDCEVTYDRRPGEAWGYHVGIDDPSDPVIVTARTLDSVLDSVFPDETIDYLKVDIEGAERQLLAVGGAWTERVRTLKIETHAPYSVERCLADLNRLGFSARPDDAHWGAVVARRR